MHCNKPDWALLVGWVFIAANLTPNYPLAGGGYAFPGYSTLYTWF
jgi:hypothetical protein